MGFNSVSATRYLDVGLFADSLTVVLKSFKRHKKTYEIPRDIVKEALNFVEEAYNPLAEKTRGEIAAQLAYLKPADLLRETLQLLKKEGKVKDDKSLDVFCKDTSKTLHALLNSPLGVRDDEIDGLQHLFSMLRGIALKRTPQVIDMGSYGIRLIS